MWSERVSGGRATGRRRVIGVAGLWLLLAHPAGAQGIEPPATFTAAETVFVVEVPVRVVVKGRPVRDLTIDNFRILDRGEPRPISGFEVIDLALAQSEAPVAASPAGQRKFLFVFDLVFTAPRDVAKAETAARELIRDGLAPSDLVAIGYFSNSGGLDVVLNFTSDRRKALEALDGLAFLLGGEVEEPVESGQGDRRDPLRLSTPSWKATLADVGLILGGEVGIAEEALLATLRDDSWGSYLQRNILINMTRLGRRAIEQQQGGTVVRLADQLGDLARRTAAVAGQKHLVFFSSGFEESLLNSGLYVPEMSAGSGTWVLNQVDGGMEELRRASWSLHAVLPGGSESSPTRRSGLFHFAAATGGELLENQNELSRGLDRLRARTEVIYLLAFEADEPSDEPTYRRLKVKLVAGPRGADVRHRDGYFAVAEPVAESPAAAAWKVGSLLAGSSEIDQLGVGTVAVPVDLSGPDARVALVIDVAGAGLMGPQGDSAAAELYVYAFDAEGRVRDFLASRVTLDLERHRRRLLDSGLQLVGDLRLPPGPHRLRFGVRSPLTGRLAVTTREIVVPEPGDLPRHPDPPMLVVDEADRGVVVVESSSKNVDCQTPYPFTLGPLSLAPSARPTLRARQRARVALMGFDLMGRPLMARLVAHHASGLAVAMSEIQSVAGGDGKPDVRLLEIDTADLAAGKYWLEMKVGTPPTAGESPTVRVTFQVEP